MSGISAHMIVKNEDQWVGYSLKSILPYVDEVLVTDTGSTDKTLSIIKSIKSDKLKLTCITASTPAEITKARSDQLERTSMPWIWIVDADEIYPERTARECVDLIQNKEIEGILVRRYDLLGDIYHRQLESVGSYTLFGHTGHLLVRLVNLDKLKGLSYRGDYPLEGFYDRDGNSILTHDASLWPATKNYLYHAMYLKRSSLGSNLPMFNRSKYRVETGVKIVGEVPVLLKGFPKRSLIYELIASVVTPIKNLKRKLL
jgi:glycosyltransferase involved in cell wall biosynthesis